MRKRFTQTLIVSTALGCATAIAADFVGEVAPKPETPKEVAEMRASQMKAKRTRPQPKAGQAPKRIVGGDSNDKPLFGMMWESYEYYDWHGVREVKSDGRHKPIKQMDDMPFAGCYIDGKYLSVFCDDTDGAPPYVTYITYDVNTWTQVGYYFSFVYTNPDILPYGLTYDPTSQTVYGSVFHDAWTRIQTSDAQFCKVNLDNMFEPITIIGEMPVRMRAMAASQDGVIYGVGADNSLYTINKYNAETTKIADLDIEFNSFYIGRESMVMDWETGYLYMSYMDKAYDTFIVRIDPSDGSVRMAGDFGYESGGSGTCDLFCSLWFEQSAAVASGTPLPVSGLEVSPLGVELKASVKFTMPSNNTDNEPLDSTLDWIISDGTVDLASGKAEPGSVVNTTVTFPSAGKLNLVVYAACGDKRSNPVSEGVFAGPDTPVIDGLPSARANNDYSRLTVQWNAARPANNGNFAAPVTYTVTRMPDNAIVAAGLSENKYVDILTSDIKTRYSYLITPVAGEVIGDAVTSRQSFGGRYFALPHTDDFTDNDLFLQYPVIDGNNDDHLWDFNASRKAAFYESTSKNADDYLLIGPFKGEAGSTYTFSFTADGYSCREKVAAYVGSNPDDVKSFSHQIVAPTEVDPLKGESLLEGSYEATESGDLYFAIHACSGANTQFLYIYDVAVNVIGPKCPAAPTDIKVTPGATDAKLEFTMPATNLDGSPATGLTAAKIYRDGNLIKTITEGISKGSRVTFVDKDEVGTGYHNYKVCAVNAVGSGKSAGLQVYRGLDYPGTPRNLRIWEDLETPGLMHITFDHPECGYNGGYYDPEHTTYLLDYLVWGGASGLVTLGSGTEFTFRYPGELKVQEPFAGSVYGRNASGEVRLSWNTKTATIGPAKNLPHRESWAGQLYENGEWTGCSTDDKPGIFETYWEVRDGGNSSVKPQDADGGMLVLNSTIENGSHRILAPRVTLKGAENPTIVFYYRYTEAASEFLLEVIDEDKPIRTFKQLDLSPENRGKWLRMEIPVKEFVNSKYVQFVFNGCGSNAEEIICIDNFSITDYVAYDLSVVDFTSPVKIAVNESGTFKVKIRNNGGKEVRKGDYSVKFIKNGSVIDEVSPASMPSFSNLELSFSDTPTVMDPESSEYSVEIVFADDAKPSDNSSALRIVRIVTQQFPTVTDLEATDFSGVLLRWSDPNTSTLPGTPVTESFEDYKSYIYNNIGEWEVYDGDKRPTVRIALDYSGPLDYPNAGAAMAWQVIDPEDAGIIGNAWFARSGKQLLASFQACIDNSRNVACDDWLISPELNACAQKVSFYSCSGMKTLSPEIFDFMISSTGNSVSDFTPLASDVEVPYSPDDWTEFEFSLPEGTRYFAIVHKSVGKLAMLVDDITYVPAGSQPMSLELQGFNVYRDGVRINSEPIAENEYHDRGVKIGNTYTYHVSAVWDKGESPLSNKVEISPSTGIAEVDADGFKVTTSGATIRVDGVDGVVALYSTSGVCVGSGRASGSIEFTVSASGIYVVKSAHNTAKVVIRL